MHGAVRPIAASWDFGRSWPISMTAAVSGRRLPATMDKVLLRSARRACFDDMIQHSLLLLVFAGGKFSLIRPPAQVAGGLADSPTAVFCIPYRNIKCTNGAAWTPTEQKSKDSDVRPSGRFRDGLVRRFLAPSGACTRRPTRISGPSIVTRGRYNTNSALKTQCGPGRIFLIPALRVPRPSTGRSGPPIWHYACHQCGLIVRPQIAKSLRTPTRLAIARIPVRRVLSTAGRRRTSTRLAAASSLSRFSQCE